MKANQSCPSARWPSNEVFDSKYGFHETKLKLVGGKSFHLAEISLIPYLYQTKTRYETGKYRFSPSCTTPVGAGESKTFINLQIIHTFFSFPLMNISDDLLLLMGIARKSNDKNEQYYRVLCCYRITTMLFNVFGGIRKCEPLCIIQWTKILEYVEFEENRRLISHFMSCFVIQNFDPSEGEVLEGGVRYLASSQQIPGNNGMCEI